MKSNTLKNLIVVLGVVAVLVVNSLANILPLNNLTTGEISDRFKVYFVPAGYVFSIWGLIYLGLILYAIYQALPSQRDNPRVNAISGWFGLSCLANIVWLFLWHFEQFPLTILAMLALLVFLIMIYQCLNIDHEAISSAEKWLVHVPFSIYLGWVSVATIANATSLLDYWKWNGWGLAPQAWAVIMLAIGALLAGFVGYTRRDIAYSLVFVWAFAGIGVKQAADPTVSSAAWVATGLVALLVFYLISLRFRKRVKSE